MQSDDVIDATLSGENRGIIAFSTLMLLTEN
jgi:hypothetical protein